MKTNQKLNQTSSMKTNQKLNQTPSMKTDMKLKQSSTRTAMDSTGSQFQEPNKSPTRTAMENTENHFQLPNKNVKTLQEDIKYLKRRNLEFISRAEICYMENKMTDMKDCESDTWLACEMILKSIKL